MEDGRRWQTDLNTVCVCTSGKVTCQVNIKGKKIAQLLSVCLYHPLSLFIFSPLSLSLSLSHTYKNTHQRMYSWRYHPMPMYLCHYLYFVVAFYFEVYGYVI